MRPLQPGPAVGLAAQLALLGALGGVLGLDASGRLVGVIVALGVTVGLHRTMSRHGTTRLGPGDRVTLGRATLVCALAALTADGLAQAVPQHRVAYLCLAAVALVLDAVDGPVARRTGSVSALGARFDMEVDALLVLVLSVQVAPVVGHWVLSIGAARYALAAASLVLPWLGAGSPSRYWRKVVAAVQGTVLLVAAAGVLPVVTIRVMVATSLGLLVVSFATQVHELRALRSRTDRPPRHHSARIAVTDA